MERPKSWLTILVKAIRAKEAGELHPFTDQDIAESNDWATCAIGEHRSTRTIYVENGGIVVGQFECCPQSIGTYHQKEEWWLMLNHSSPDSSLSPIDVGIGGRLNHLGIDFDQAVRAQDPVLALSIYSQIHELWDQAPENSKNKFNPANPVTG